MEPVRDTISRAIDNLIICGIDITAHVSVYSAVRAPVDKAVHLTAGVVIDVAICRELART